MFMTMVEAIMQKRN